MRTSLVPLAAIATLAAVTSLGYLAHASPEAEPGAAAAPTDGARMHSRLPVAFVPNLGQWMHEAAYVARFGAMTVFLEEEGWTFTLMEPSEKPRELSEIGTHAPLEPDKARGVAVRMTFADAGIAELMPQQRAAWRAPLLPGR